MTSSGGDAVTGFFKETLQLEWLCAIPRMTQQVLTARQPTHAFVQSVLSHPKHITSSSFWQVKLIKWQQGKVTLLPEASLPFPSSATWKRRFSRRKTDPVAGLAQAASTSEPTQSFRKVTFLQREDGPSVRSSWLILCKRTSWTNIQPSQQGLQLSSNRFQGIFLRHEVSVRAAQVAHQNNRFGSIVQAVLDAGNSSLNP